MAILRMPEYIRRHPDRELRHHWQEVLRRLGGVGGGAATLRNLFNDNTILKADADNTPEALEVAPETLVGRVTGGKIAALTAAQVKTLLGLPLLTVKEDAAISESVSITNAGFENGDLTGWTTTADAGSGPAADNSATIFGVAKPAGWGTWFCHMGNTNGGTGGENTIAQSIDLSSLDAYYLDRIDDGTLSLVVKADLIGQLGTNDGDDEYSITATFKTSGGSTIKTLTTGTLTVPDGLEEDKTVGPTTAPNCRTVEIEISCIQRDTIGSQNHELAVDNVRLTLQGSALTVDGVDTIEVDAGKLIDDGGGQVSLDLSGDGATAFTGLSDTPASIAAAAILKGASGGGSLEELPVGTNGQVLTVVSGAPAWATSTATGGGLVLQETDEADGTAEHVQASITITPSSATRIFFYGRELRPEIDGDAFNITFILDDDSELTSAVYDYELFGSRTGVGAIQFSLSAQSAFNIGGMGNASGEGLDFTFQLASLNGSEATKVFFVRTANRRSDGSFAVLDGAIRVATTNSIKGIRVDTDNTGDMINAGQLEAWAQS